MICGCTLRDPLLSDPAFPGIPQDKDTIVIAFYRPQWRNFRLASSLYPQKTDALDPNPSCPKKVVDCLLSSLDRALEESNERDGVLAPLQHMSLDEPIVRVKEWFSESQKDKSYATRFYVMPDMLELEDPFTLKGPKLTIHFDASNWGVDQQQEPMKIGTLEFWRRFFFGPAPKPVYKYSFFYEFRARLVDVVQHQVLIEDKCLYNTKDHRPDLTSWYDFTEHDGEVLKQTATTASEFCADQFTRSFGMKVAEFLQASGTKN
jgi:hypothetical protein